MANGYCDKTRQYPDGTFVTVCGLNGTSNVAPVEVTLKNGSTEMCVACCQAKGE
jgi:hypothetical protein